VTATHWICRALCEAVLKAFFGYEIEGRDHCIEEGGAIIASNHASFLDPPVVGCAYGQELSYMARNTLFKGAFGWLLPRLNAIPVDREQADLKSMKTILRALKEGRRILMFPEGTRSRDGELQAAKPGIGMLIAKSRAPVQPVRVIGSHEALGRDGKIRFRPVKVVVGKPVAFTAEELASKSREGYQRLSDRVLGEIRALGGE